MTSNTLSLFQQLIEAQKVNFTLLEAPYDQVGNFDLGLRKKIYQNYSFDNFLDFLISLGTDPILYHYTDSYECTYSFFLLEKENTKPTFLIIGPYLAEEITTNQFHSILKKLNLPIIMENELREYYNALPVFQEITRFHSMLSILTRQLLNNPHDFSIKFIGPFNEIYPDQIQFDLIFLMYFHLK